jgi:hypothetical protein
MRLRWSRGLRLSWPRWASVSDPDWAQPSSSNDVSPSCKTDSKGALMRLSQRSLMREVGLHRGNLGGPSTCIPNSSPSQVRFNPNELNLRPMRSRFPRKCHPRALGLELHCFLLWGRVLVFDPMACEGSHVLKAIKIAGILWRWGSRRSDTTSQEEESTVTSHHYERMVRLNQDHYGMSLSK